MPEGKRFCTVQSRTRPTYPKLRRIFRRKKYSHAQSKQARWFIHAANVAGELSLNPPCDSKAERAYWAGVNHVLNDLWSLAINHDPVFCKGLWSRLEDRVDE